MSKNNLSWRDVYHLPLDIMQDGEFVDNYAFSNQGVMALQFGNRVPKQERLDIVESINKNGDTLLKYDDVLIKDEVDVYEGNRKLFTVRGWGHLTGIGGCKLSDVQAAELQDEFLDYIENCLIK